ncbi:DMT family transporter [Campylobacter suis]|uniref:EamA domain-containing protein n=1 Tax=Campylobacter suis TaxID=2790657 RepID=A0ABN7K3Q0_9BACT|nr:DMT family transporter [Campylobacter suis]CAD7287090.1 hypothetical protein LMG8286_00721 [Campylobacter suis]
MRQLNTNEASFALVIGCVLFGLGSIIVASISVGAFAIAFWRLFIAGGIFFVLTKALKLPLLKSKKAKLYAVLSGAFLGIDLSLWHESIYAVGPGISTLLNSLQIFWLTFIGLFFFGERLSKFGIFALVLASFGVFLIALPEFNSNLHAGWGFISGILSGLLLALSMISVKKASESENAHIITLMFYIGVGGASALLVPSILLNGANFFPKDVNEILLTFTYASVMQCVAWGMIAYCVPLLSLSLTGLLLLSEPIAALFIDAFLLDKDINAWQWAGAFITMLAIYLGSLKSKKDKNGKN